MEKIFDKELSLNFTELALKNIRREFPHTGHSLSDPSDVKILLPCIQYSMAALTGTHACKLDARSYFKNPGIKIAREIKSALNDTLSSENLRRQSILKSIH